MVSHETQEEEFTNICRYFCKSLHREEFTKVTTCLEIETSFLVVSLDLSFTLSFMGDFSHVGFPYYSIL